MMTRVVCIVVVVVVSDKRRVLCHIGIQLLIGQMEKKIELN